MTTQAVPVASDSGAPTATSALSQLPDLGQRLAFELRRSRITSSGGMVNQTIAGDMPVVDTSGREVLTLSFESASRSRHLHAALAVTNGPRIAALDMGAVPEASAGGMFSSIGADYSMRAPPPIQLSVLGQAYGSYTCTGYMNCGIQSGGQWRRVDGSGAATVDKPPVETSCCFPFCCYTGQDVTRKTSALGKREVPMNARFTDSGAAAEPTTIHLVTDASEGRMPNGLSTNVREIVCELDGSVGRKRLDLILMGASLAALNATTKVPSN